MAEQMLMAAKAEREEILNNLNNTRDIIAKYEKLLKPHIPKPPPIIDDVDEDSASISDDSL